MKRISILGSLLILGALSATLAAVQQGRQGAAGAKPVPFGQETPSADALMVEKVKPNLYVLRGGGGPMAQMRADLVRAKQALARKRNRKKMRREAE